MNKRRNLQSIEVMRGIAAFMVAYFHIARGNRSYLDHDNILFQIGAYGWAGVEIFFVISGFVITYAMFHGGYSINRIHRFFGKRLIRLEPPYVVSIILVLLLTYISTLSPYYRGKPLNIDWWNAIGHLGYVNAFTGAKWLQDVYWTLAIEFEFYIGLALIFPLLLNKNKIVSHAAIIALLVMSFISLEQIHVFAYLSFFCIGITTALYLINRLTRIEYLLFVAAAVIITVYIHGYILTSLGLATICAIFLVKNAPKPLLWLGKISYSLYLLHIPFGGRIINLSVNFVKAEWQRSVMVFVALGFCLVIAHFFYKLVERPFQKISKRIKY